MELILQRFLSDESVNWSQILNPEAGPNRLRGSGPAPRRPNLLRNGPIPEWRPLPGRSQKLRHL